MISRIVNGETAEAGAWSWTVSLDLRQDLCGGAILSASWIITAAHCLENILVSDVIVYAGSNHVWSGTQIKSASYFVVHPNYDPNTMVNDIALIKLISPLDVRSSNLGTICLPSVDSITLANSEWPPANTTVRNFSLLFKEFIWKF